MATLPSLPPSSSSPPPFSNPKTPKKSTLSHHPNPKTPNSRNSNSSTSHGGAIHLDLHLPTAAAYTNLIRTAATSSPPDFPVAAAACAAMVAAGHLPDEFTFPFALRSCAQLGLLPLGLQLHSLLAKSHRRLLSSNLFCAAALLDFYAKIGPPAAARQVFDAIPQKNHVVWNCMIMRYAQDGHLELSLELMDKMVKSGLDPDVSTWNAIVAGCVRSGNAALTMEIVGKMVLAGGVMPNVATFNTLLHTLAALPSVDILKELHGFAIRNAMVVGFGPVDWDRLQAALAAGYASSGCMDYASRVFHDVKVSTCQLGNSMISGFLASGWSREACDVFREMAFGCGYEAQPMSRVSLTLVLSEVGQVSKKGLEIHGYAYRRGMECDTSVCNALMAVYARRGNIDSAEKVFQQFEDKDTVSWNTIISSYAMIHDFDRSFELFQEMQANDIRPDEYSFSSVLNGCSFVLYLRQAMALHGQMMKMGLCQSYVADLNALMDAYGKCGSIEDAHKVFDEIDVKDTISWNIIISCYGYSAFPRKAISLFNRMQEQGYKPNRVTFIALLSACSHAGLLDGVLHYFEVMKSHYGIMPDVDHYACIVDCFGRAGQLERAYEFIKGMPIVPDDCVWGALLSSCRIHGNIDLAEIAAKKLIELHPQHSGYWVLLSNIYAKASRWRDVRQLRAAMKDMGVKKCPGYSWIEVGDSELHRFLTADKLHKQCDDIYLVLDGLTGQLIDEGYKPRIDVDLIYADQENETTEMMIG